MIYCRIPVLCGVASLVLPGCSICYEDADSDGLGGETTVICSASDDAVEVGGDPDDADPTNADCESVVASSVANLLALWEVVLAEIEIDLDSDGFPAARDCDDMDATLGPVYLVDSDGAFIESYSTPQLAIDEAEAGNIVHVCGGPHEGFTIDTDDITVMGDPYGDDLLLPMIGGMRSDDLEPLITIESYTSGTLLEGLLLYGGYAEKGAGLFIGEESDVTGANLLITSNIATEDGGGVWAGETNEDFPITLTNVLVVDNMVLKGEFNDGGGIHLHESFMEISSDAARWQNWGSGEFPSWLEWYYSGITGNYDVSDDTSPGGGIAIRVGTDYGDSAYLGMQNTCIGENYESDVTLDPDETDPGVDSAINYGFMVTDVECQDDDGCVGG